MSLLDSIILAAEMLTTAPQVPSPAVFTFRAETRIAQDRIYLGQLADCGGAQVICEEAYGVDLGPSPVPGKTLTWNRRKLTELLTREWDAAAIEIKAPEMIRIDGEGAPIDVAVVEHRLRDFLTEEFESRDDLTLEVHKVSFSAAPVVRPGTLDIAFPEWRGAGEQSEDWLLKNVAGNQRIEVFLAVDGSESIHPANVVIKIKKAMPVLRRNMLRGEVIGADDVEVQKTEYVRGSNRYVMKLASVVGKRLKSPVAVGQPILATQLETQMVLKKGQLARLTLAKGGLSVSGMVRAQSGGTYGEAIDAVYPATKKTIRVRIVDQTTVEFIR